MRSLLYDEEENVLVTGGEDGKLNVWPWPSSFVSHGGDENMDVDVPVSSPQPPSPPKKRRQRDVSPSGGGDGRRDSEDYLNGEVLIFSSPFLTSHLTFCVGGSEEG